MFVSSGKFSLFLFVFSNLCLLFQYDFDILDNTISTTHDLVQPFWRNQRIFFLKVCRLVPHWVKSTETDTYGSSFKLKPLQVVSWMSTFRLEYHYMFTCLYLFRREKKLHIAQEDE